MFTVIPAKPAIVQVIQEATPERYTLELTREQLRFIYSLQANMPTHQPHYITYETWLKIEEVIGKNNYCQDPAFEAACGQIVETYKPE